MVSMHEWAKAKHGEGKRLVVVHGAETMDETRREGLCGPIPWSCARDLGENLGMVFGNADHVAVYVRHDASAKDGFAIARVVEDVTYADSTKRPLLVKLSEWLKQMDARGLRRKLVVCPSWRVANDPLAAGLTMWKMFDTSDPHPDEERPTALYKYDCAYICEVVGNAERMRAEELAAEVWGEGEDAPYSERLSPRRDGCEIDDLYVRNPTIIIPMDFASTKTFSIETSLHVHGDKGTLLYLNCLLPSTMAQFQHPRLHGGWGVEVVGWTRRLNVQSPLFEAVRIDLKLKDPSQWNRFAKANPELNAKFACGKNADLLITGIADVTAEKQTERTYGADHLHVRPAQPSDNTIVGVVASGVEKGQPVAIGFDHMVVGKPTESKSTPLYRRTGGASQPLSPSWDPFMKWMNERTPTPLHTRASNEPSVIIATPKEVNARTATSVEGGEEAMLLTASTCDLVAANGGITECVESARRTTWVDSALVVYADLDPKDLVLHVSRGNSQIETTTHDNVTPQDAARITLETIRKNRDVGEKVVVFVEHMGIGASMYDAIKTIAKDERISVEPIWRDSKKRRDNRNPPTPIGDLGAAKSDVAEFAKMSDGHTHTSALPYHLPVVVQTFEQLHSACADIPTIAKNATDALAELHAVMDVVTSMTVVTRERDACRRWLRRFEQKLYATLGIDGVTIAMCHDEIFRAIRRLKAATTSVNGETPSAGDTKDSAVEEREGEEVGGLARGPVDRAMDAIAKVGTTNHAPSPVHVHQHPFTHHMALVVRALERLESTYTTTSHVTEGTVAALNDLRTTFGSAKEAMSDAGLDPNKVLDGLSAFQSATSSQPTGPTIDEFEEALGLAAIATPFDVRRQFNFDVRFADLCTRMDVLRQRSSGTTAKHLRSKLLLVSLSPNDFSKLERSSPALIQQLLDAGRPKDLRAPQPPAPMVPPSPSAWNTCPACGELADVPDEVMPGARFKCVNCAVPLYAELFEGEIWHLFKASDVDAEPEDGADEKAGVHVGYKGGEKVEDGVGNATQTSPPSPWIPHDNFKTSKLEVVRDIEAFDGPILTELHGADGSTYIKKWCSFDDHRRVVRSLYVRSDGRMIAKYMDRQITLLDLLMSANDTGFIVDQADGRDDVAYICRVSALPSSYLPTTDCWHEESLRAEGTAVEVTGEGLLGQYLPHTNFDVRVLEFVRDLEVFDGPTLTELRDAKGRTYIKKWGRIDGSGARDLFVRSNAHMVVKYLCKEITLRDLLMANDDVGFIVDQTPGGKTSTFVCQVSTLPPPYLPTVDYRHEELLRPERTSVATVGSEQTDADRIGELKAMLDRLSTAVDGLTKKPLKVDADITPRAIRVE